MVDDEPGVRELAVAFSKARGYGVLEAGDGQQASRSWPARPKWIS